MEDFSAGPFAYADRDLWEKFKDALPKKAPKTKMFEQACSLLSKTRGVVGMKHLRAAMEGILLEKSEIHGGSHSVFVYAYVVHLLGGSDDDDETAKKREIAKHLIAAASDDTDYLFGFLFPAVYEDIRGLHGVVALSGICSERGTNNIVFTAEQKRALGACLSFMESRVLEKLSLALRIFAGHFPTSENKIEEFAECKDVFWGYITSDITATCFSEAVEHVDRLCSAAVKWFDMNEYRDVNNDLNFYRRVVVPDNRGIAGILVRRIKGPLLSPQDKARMDRDIWHKRAAEIFCAGFKIDY